MWRSWREGSTIKNKSMTPTKEIAPLAQLRHLVAGLETTAGTDSVHREEEDHFKTRWIIYSNRFTRGFFVL